MKFDDLRSIAHNLADSFGSGASLLFNYGFYPYEDAARSLDGCLEVDFLTGAIVSGTPSHELLERLALSPALLADLCAHYGETVKAYAYFRARYVTTSAGREFEVTVSDRSGRRTTDRYSGISGKRLQVGKHSPVANA